MITGVILGGLFGKHISGDSITFIFFAFLGVGLPCWIGGVKKMIDINVIKRKSINTFYTKSKKGVKFIGMIIGVLSVIFEITIFILFTIISIILKSPVMAVRKLYYLRK